MMIRTLISKSAIIIFIPVCCFVAGLNAQYENENIADIRTEAKKNFDAGNYSVSLLQYKSLLKRYPKDGVFSYYCGLSLLNMNEDVEEAIEYLEFASSKTTVPYQVFYFLGQAYTRNYQFSQAKKAYSKFAAVATKTETKELMPERLSEMSDNAIGLTSTFNQIEILASSLFTFSDSGFIRQIAAPGGTLSLKPSELLPSKDGIKDLSNLMFIPRNRNKGDLLFYVGYGKNKKKGYEIFMVKTGDGRKLSEPMAVEALNTNYDEIMPYFDSIGGNLFFASKGHNSMGGFDLFRSHYDTDRNTWTPPVNMGFPINSPFDEYLLIPGTDLGNILLITNRQGLDSMITAYLLRIHEPPIQMVNSDPDELKKIGNLGGIEAINDMVDMSAQGILTVADSVSVPVISTGKHPKPGDQEGKFPLDYNKYLRLALDQQFKSDSLARLAREARIEVKNIPDPDDRWAIQKNIISWEKQSANYQAKADEYYLMVRNMVKESPATKKVPEAIEIDTVISDITVYNYKLQDSNPEKADSLLQAVNIPGKDKKIPVSSEPEKEVETEKSSLIVKNEFVVLAKSPYSQNNPFLAELSFPDGAYYKIQMAVLSKNPAWNAFGGLSPVTFEPVTGKPLKKYYAGRFRDYKSAKTALEEVRKQGFAEAFIVGWYDGIKMTVNKVVELEKK